MSINDVALSGGMRNNLFNLQSITMQQARTSLRLATGKRVNTAVDDASNFFAAKDHMDHANDLAGRKDGMSEGLSTIQAASAGIDGISALITQAKGLITSARSATTTDRATLATQYNALLTQINTLAGDGGYKGTNLLSSTGKLTVSFNESGSSSVTVSGFDASSTGLGVLAAVGSWAADSNLDTAQTQLDTATSSLRTNSSTLAANSSVITTRQSFTDALINTLTQGSDNLTLADQNSESANMLTLQTRQSLAVSSMSLSNQASQSILRLF